jgi:hypothetical protein
VSASQFVIENIISVLGGAGVLVTGLATYLGKFWADKSLLREKSKLQGDIKVLENTLQLEIIKRDQYHQISKSTFEKLFDEKVNIYTGLLAVCLEYKKFELENGFNEVFDYNYNAALSFVNIMKKEIESKRLYVSDPLIQKFNSWYLKASIFYRKLEVIEIEIQRELGLKAPGLSEKISEAQEDTIRKMLLETGTELNGIFERIELDASEFRKSMHLL